MSGRIDWEAVERRVLAQLKPFQRRTVDWAFRCLFPTDSGPCSGRFLVADEVGLGKTMIARGILARTLRHLDGKVGRIDVVYICSNADIARQNLARLKIPELGAAGFQSQGRLTLMPLIPLGSDGRPERPAALPTHGINLQALTPGTSLDFRNDPGHAHERALLAVMVAAAVPSVTMTRWRNLFTQQVGHERFGALIDRVTTRFAIDKAMQRDFAKALRQKVSGGQSLGERLLDLAGHFPRQRKYRARDEDQQQAARLIADLRRALAKVCITALEPDLLILDEFQRFQHLLDQHDPNAELARQLFDQDQAGQATRVLMLSATPYRMSSLGDVDQQQTHQQEFLATIRFLMRDDQLRLGRLSKLLESFNDGLRALDVGNLTGVQAVRQEIQTLLLQVMSRTDRTPTSAGRNAMVIAPPSMAHPSAEQMVVYARLHSLARMLEQPDLVEYWRSAPAPLSFLSGYKLRDALAAALNGNSPAVLAAVRAPGLFLGGPGNVGSSPESGHARTAALADALIGAGMHRLLWLPPARPSYAPGGPYVSLGDAARTKRLIFSSWRMVPRAVSTVLDGLFAEALRSELGAASNRRHEEADGDFALGYPCSSLAELAPAVELALAEDFAGQMPTLDLCAERLQPAVAALVAMVEQSFGGDATGHEDYDWYWLGPVLADQLVWKQRFGMAGQMFPPLDMAQLDALRDGGSTWQPGMHAARIERYQGVVNGSKPLGRKPDDLVEVLSRVAIAGPAICALRSLSTDQADLWSPAFRQTASAVGAGLLHYFGHEQAVQLLAGLYPAERSFWSRALRYCGDGNLQAVLDEYASVLRDDQPVDPDLDPKGIEALHDRLEHLERVLRLKPAVLRPEVLTEDDAGNLRLTPQARSLRHARPLLEERSDGEDSDGPAPMTQLRAAFNSPFLPFVLSSTSIGQEGLDFHWYCHAIVHWNLPDSPVDFEQRDGRIHRYRNHAVRRNLARDWAGASIRHAPGRAGWDWMFAQATQAVCLAGEDAGGMRPAWVYEEGDSASPVPTPDWMLQHIGGPARIERHVPVMPHSRDGQRLQRMTEAVGCYRMVFAQPRQDDLLAHLRRSHSEDDLRRLAEAVVIDLRPRSTPEPGLEAG